MIAMIKRPGFEMKGDIPAAFLKVTQDFFGADDVEVVMEDGDGFVNVFDTAWAKKMESMDSPGSNVKTYRKIHELTQANLADKLGIMRHHVTEIEKGRRAISKDMAHKLADLFKVPIDRFI